MIITPKLKHEYHDDYYRLVKDYAKLKTAFGGLSAEQKEIRKKVIENFERKVKFAKERANSESQLNMKIAKASFGECVKYGDEICLLHKDSSGFLVSKNECSKTDQIGYKLEFTTNISSNMIFTLESRYKSLSRGDFVQYGDDLRLMNKKNSNFLAVSLFNFEISEELEEDDNPYVITKMLADPTSMKHKVYLGGVLHNTWKIFPQSKHNPFKTEFLGETVNLYGNDLVRIFHSELKAYLASSLCFEDRIPEVYFRSYDGQHETENYSLNTVWELVHKGTVLQGSTFKLDDESILLRHFNSGRLIMIDTITGKVNLAYLGDTGGTNPSSLVNHLILIPLEDGVKVAKTNSSFRITTFSSQNERLYLNQFNYNLSYNSLRNNPSTKRLSNISLFTPLEDQYYEETMVLSVFTQKMNIEEAYILKKVPESERKNILHLRSALLEILPLVKIYKQKKQDLLRSQYLVKMETLLKQLMYFIFDKEYEDGCPLDFDELGNPQDQRQILFKNLNFLEIMIDLIHYPFYNRFYRTDTVHKILYAPQLITLAYSCIRYGIMEYRPNELYASQWLDLIIEYSLGDLDDSIRANETLKELIDNNEKILESRIKKPTIFKFVKNLIESGGDKKFTDILRVICICNEKPMLKNQQIISEAILKNEDNRQVLILSLTDKEGELCIRSPWSEIESWLPLVQLHSESLSRNDGRYFEFYCSLIFLLADLCQDRNYNTIRTVRSYFPLEYCIKIICSKEYSYIMRSAFSKLILNLWIDVTPFIQQTIPSNIKIWNSVENMDSLRIPSLNSENMIQYQDLVSFIFEFLESEKIEENFEDKGEFLLQIVNVVSMMLHIGFFESKERFLQLYTHLTIILKKTDELIFSEIKENYELESLKEILGKIDFDRLDISKTLFDVKKKICNLIKDLISIQNDFKLTELIKRYKKQHDVHSEKSFTRSISEIDSLLGTRNALEISKHLKCIIPEEQRRSAFESSFLEMINNQEISFLKRDKSFLEVLMIQTLFSDPVLKATSLELLYAMFRTSTSLRENIITLQIIESKSEQIELESMEETRNYLFRLAETIEVWYDDVESDNYHQILIIFSRLGNRLRNEASTVESISDLAIEEGLDSLLNQYGFLKIFLNNSFQNLNKFIQDLCRNTNCIEDIIEIMQNIYLSDEDILMEKRQEELSFTVNIILAEICYNNSLNSNYVSNKMFDIINRQLRRKNFDFNLTILLNSLLTNSVYLMENPKRFKTLVKNIVFCMINNQNDPYKLSFLMTTVQMSIYHNSQTITSHQNFIISQLISPSLKRALAHLTSGNFASDLEKNIKEKPIKFNYMSLTVVAMSSKLCLNMATMDLISNCSFDRNAFAENIAQSLILAKDIEKIILIQGLHPLVQYEVCKYIFHVFLETEKTYSRHNRSFLFVAMKFFHKSLLDSISALQKNDLIAIYYLTHKELVSEQNVHTDLIVMITKSIEQFISEIAKDALSRQDFVNYADFIITVYTSLNSLIENGLAIDSYIVKKIKLSLNALRECMISSSTFNNNNIDDVSLRISQTFNFPKDNDKTLLNKKDVILNKEKKGMNKKSKEGEEIDLKKIVETQKAALKIKRLATDNRKDQLLTIFRKEALNGIGKVSLIHDKSSLFKTLADVYFVSDSYTRAIDSEFMEFLKIFTVEDSFIFRRFVKNLVTYIDSSYLHISEDIQLIGLQIFGEFLNTSHNNSETQKTDRMIVQRQKTMMDIGLIELLVKLLTLYMGENNKHKLIDAIFDVAIKMLNGGNIESQRRFLEVFKIFQCKGLFEKFYNMLNEKLAHFSKLMINENSNLFRNMIDGKEMFAFKASTLVNPKEEQIFCAKIFNFLQLLCEGHNKNLQNYLREQVDEKNNSEDTVSANFDLIQLSVDFYGNYTKFFNSKCVELGEMLLNFMIESIQGPCKGNQDTMIRSKILSYVKDFLNELSPSAILLEKGFGSSKNEETQKSDRETLHTLFSLNIKLILSLLESNFEKEIIEEVGQNINFQVLNSKLNDVYLDYLDSLHIRRDSILSSNHKSLRVMQKIRTSLFPKVIVESYDIFFLCQIINDYTGIYQAQITNLKEEQRDAYDFFQYSCGNIELVFEEKLQKVYFLKHPACHYLDSKYKQDLMSRINRDNPNEKLSDFLSRTNYCFDLMNHFFKLSQNSSIRITPTYLENVRVLALVVSCIVNLYILFIFKKQLINGKSYLLINRVQAFGIASLGVAHLLLAFLLLLLHFIIKTKLVYMSEWRKFLLEFKKKLLRDPSIDEDKLQNLLGILDKDPQYLTYNEKGKIFKAIRLLDTDGDIRPLPRLMQFYYSFNFYLKDQVLLYFCFYFLCSVMAITMDNYVLYSFSLFEIISRFDTLQNVIKAITFPRTQLFLTIILGLVVMWGYTLIGYFYLNDAFWNSSFGDSGENQCTSVIHCFFTLVSLGPRSSGSIGDMMIRESYMLDNRIRYLVRYIYDLSFFIVVNIIIMNIIYGIIIDTFKDLRSKKQMIDEDKDNVCFICSLNRHIFENFQGGFSKHIRKDHNVWNYLFYLYNLKNKSNTEYTGIESYVESMIEKDDHFWIPLEQAISLTTFKEEETNLEDKIQRIREQAMLIESKLDRAIEKREKMITFNEPANN